ncbi:MAG TPA: inorganic phosphate transporter [Anaerolineales bacterium]|nr:inorganic phosphate transporter [Anaerolineales bacterium]HNB36469.1 inorganic phosphate transporter [Anaerolineales bacterium]HNC07824.1 inorganic phosphate transporter [Anaerolineales bacterium]
MLISVLLIIVIICALTYAFINGMRDSSAIVATMISSRAFHPRAALGLTALAEFLGPLLFGVTVAKTIGGDIVSAQAISLQTLVAGLLGAVVWNLITWFLGIPSSSSHALIGGLVGAAALSSGWAAVKFAGFVRVLLALFISPLVGFAIGFFVLKLIYLLSQSATPNINNLFKQIQVVTAVVLALSHGTNDAQKTIGIITLSLVIGGQLSNFQIPIWVILVSAGVMASGTALGGWRLIRTLGGKFYKIRPVHGFATQLSSGLVILTATLTGLPVSTSQVVSSAIIGVGASERFGKVRWGVAGDILTAWVVTIPISALFSALIYSLIHLFL